MSLDGRLHHEPSTNMFIFMEDLSHEADSQIMLHFHQRYKIVHLALMKNCQDI